MNIAQLNSPVAENTKSIIEESGYRQNAIAEKAGYPSQMFNEMLNGRRLIKPWDVTNIAKALEVTPNQLYGIEQA